MKHWRKLLSLCCCGFFVLFFFVFSSYYELHSDSSLISSFANYNELYGFEEVSTSPLALVSNSKSGPVHLKNLVVFIKFSDSDTLTSHHLDDLESVRNAEKIYNSDTFSMNTVNGVLNVPSFKTYFKRQSYGNLLIDTEIFPKKNGNVVSYQSNHPMGYYQKYSASNPIGYRNSEESLARETELINQAILSVQSQIENSVSSSEIDLKNDGVVDSINFVVEGLSAFSSNISWGDLLWSHKLDNSNLTATIFGKRVIGYNLLYAYDYTETAGLFSLDKGTYGTLIHEYGHTLGFSDLYRHGASSGERPVGFFDVMGNVIGSNPQSFLSYFISDYRAETNWHQPLPVVNTSKTVTLVKPSYIDPQEQRAVKIQLDDGNDEYFILEYHEKMNTYPDYSVDESGVILYRVNEKNKNVGNNGSGTNGQQDLIYVFRPNETTLGAAKGNLSEATLTMKRPTLGKNITIGNTNFDSNTIYYSDGSNSGLVLRVTNQTKDSVTVEITFPTLNGSGTKSDPYLIDSVNSFLFYMTRSTTGKYYKLLNNLDFASVTDYPAITFEGYLDGSSKTLKNITTKGTGIFQDIGSFSTSSVVENLYVENIQVKPLKGDYLGGLSSVVTHGTIRNVHLKSGSVTNIAHSFNTMSSTGGLVGNISNTTTIDHCSSSLSVQAPSNVGGLIGINMNGTIQNSFSNGVVSGTNYVGGVIGLQSISDSVYHVPSHVYYDMTNQKINAVGGASALHNASSLSLSSLSKGIVGVSVPKEITLKEAERVAYFVVTTPNTSLSLTYSSNTSIATYETGYVRGVKVGSTNLSVTLRIGTLSMPFSTKVIVTKAPVTTIDITGITLNTTNASLDVGATLQLSKTILPSNTTMSKTVTWSSSNTSIAVVDNTGKVTAKKAGTVLITATTVNGKKASATITVKAKPVSLVETEVLKYYGLVKKDNYVYGFSLGAKIEDVKKLLSSHSDVKLVNFQNSSNQNISTGIISTNMKFTLQFNQKEYRYTVVIRGDVNGDGKIYATDYVKIKNHIMGKTKLTGAYFMAADINQDNQIYATDYMKIKNHIMGKSTISQK